jgi:hypothetical protein
MCRQRPCGIICTNDRKLVKDVNHSPITAATIHAAGSFLDQKIFVVWHMRKKKLRSAYLALIHRLFDLLGSAEVLFKIFELKIDV